MNHIDIRFTYVRVDHASYKLQVKTLLLVHLSVIEGSILFNRFMGQCFVFPTRVS